MPDDLGDDEPTVIDGRFLETDEITPIEVQRCQECGAVIFDDSYSDVAAAVAAGIFRGKQCVRAHDGHWSICANYSPTHMKLTLLVPR